MQLRPSMRSDQTWKQPDHPRSPQSKFCAYAAIRPMPGPNVSILAVLSRVPYHSVYQAAIVQVWIHLARCFEVRPYVCPLGSRNVNKGTGIKRVASLRGDCNLFPRCFACEDLVLRWTPRTATSTLVAAIVVCLCLCMVGVRPRSRPPELRPFDCPFPVETTCSVTRSRLPHQYRT